MTKKRGGKKGKKPDDDKPSSQPQPGPSQPAVVQPEAQPRPQSAQPAEKPKGFGRGQPPPQQGGVRGRGGGGEGPRQQVRTPAPQQQAPAGPPKAWGPPVGGQPAAMAGPPAGVALPAAWGARPQGGQAPPQQQPAPQQQPPRGPPQQYPPGLGPPQRHGPQQVPIQQMGELQVQRQDKQGRPQPKQMPPPQPKQMPPPQPKQMPPPQGRQQQPQPPTQQTQPPSRYTAPAMPEAEVSKNLSLIPCRKDPKRAGTLGRPITVEANVVSITFNKNFNPSAVHYDVAFDPDKPKFMMRLAYDEVRKRNFPQRHPAYDGRKNLFSTGNLPFGECLVDEVNIYDKERNQERTYKVTIKKVNDIDLSWLPKVAPGHIDTNQTAMQVIDVVLRNGPASRCVQVGRSFFHPPKGHVQDLSDGLELWVGMFQSAILGWKPFLNVDVAHKGFPKAQNVMDLMQEMVGTRGRFDATSVDRIRHQISKHLKGLKVTYEIPGQPASKRTQRVNELVGSATSSVFKLDSGESITVNAYYLREKRYKIKYPDFPCVWIGGRNRQIYVPAELCTIVSGQVTMKKMNENQTSAMIKYAATSTDVRKNKIMAAFEAIRFNEDPCVKEFGLSVGGGFEKVPARVLSPPQLLYDPNMRPVSVNKGVWRASRFNAAANLEPNSWTILNLDQYVKERELYNLMNELISNGAQLGMQLGEALTPFKCFRAPQRDLKEITEFFNTNKSLKLVIVVVPDRGNAYSKVKQTAELRVGVLTQCIRSRTIQRLTPATTGNLLLKINSKLNGVNHMFVPKMRPPCLNEPCIIIGADVTHPSPDAVDIPSIAAVAASHDPKAFQYNIKIQLQPPREEIILDLERIIREQLMFFYKKTGYKPNRIIFYRDGVSEGQFAQVMSSELQAIKRACKSLQKDGSYQPPITFLVVQKRHHVRLFPTARENSDDRNFNVQAGTVVDTMITHPSHIDFYLVSHASIQGTARPTKYRCLWDDKNMSEDEIEMLTYYLCHMFSRCTRSVSYPTPTYYAHLAAYRARALIEDIPINIHNLEEEQRHKLKLAEEMATKPMFFV